MLIKKYTADWINYFMELKREIEKGLFGIEFHIEHVGSTSIPGLDAKEIIDLDIIYESEREFNLIKDGLIEIGYYHNGNQGIDQREVFKRTGELTNTVLDTIKHHLYVCSRGSEALERHLLFRDFLRANEGARLEYQTMKYELAENANQDKNLYAELKELTINDFIDSIIAQEKRTKNK